MQKGRGGKRELDKEGWGGRVWAGGQRESCWADLAQREMRYLYTRHLHMMERGRRRRWAALILSLSVVYPLSFSVYLPLSLSGMSQYLSLSASHSLVLTPVVRVKQEILVQTRICNHRFDNKPISFLLVKKILQANISKQILEFHESWYEGN